MNLTNYLKETSMSDAVKRADQVRSDMDWLEAQVAEKSKARDRLRRDLSDAQRASAANDGSQRALLVYRDGRIENKPVTVEPSSNLAYQYQPVLYMSVLEDGHIAPTPPRQRWFRRDEQVSDAKLVVYTEQ